jgi:4a-hydroxytetrahydrobiopterin dehydratase
MKRVANLVEQRCQALPSGTPAIAGAQLASLLAQVPGWAHVDGAIRKTYSFADYGRTMAFANAVAWIAHCEDHHPEMTVGYNRCEVAFSTHSIGGISLNDFICAAKIEALL